MLYVHHLFLHTELLVELDGAWYMAEVNVEQGSLVQGSPILWQGLQLLGTVLWNRWLVCVYKALFVDIDNSWLSPNRTTTIYPCCSPPNV